MSRMNDDRAPLMNGPVHPQGGAADKLDTLLRPPEVRPPSGSADKDQEIELTLDIERDTIEIALRNARTSVALLLIAVGVLAFVAVKFVAPMLAALIAVTGLAVSLDRYRLSCKSQAAGRWTPQQTLQLTRQMENNACVMGAVWATVNIFVVPHMTPSYFAAYVLLHTGSLSLAAMFMSLVGRSLLILAVLQIASLEISWILLAGNGGNWIAIFILPIFGVGIVRSGAFFRRATVLAVRNGIEANAARERSKVALEAAEKANKAKSVFLATMSHELRTPLFGIQGSTSMLLGRVLNDSERDVIRTIDLSAKHLLGLLNQILQVVQVGGTQLPIEIATIDAVAIVGETVESHVALARAKGITLKCAGLATSIVMQSDAQRLRQIVFNLVGNALKFTVRGTVSVEVSCQAEMFVMSVKDTGPGMTPEIRETIFEPFNLGAGSSSWDRKRGLGLGLSITRGIAVALGGTVSCVSEVGQGSTFFVSLPLRPQIPANLRVDAPETPQDNRFMETSIWPTSTATAPGGMEWLASSGEILSDGAIDVLIVDDAAINRLVAQRILAGAGHAVTQAATAIAGLEAMASHHYGVVVLDLEMPVLSGLEVIEKFRTIAPGRPEPAWVILTGHNADQARMSAKALGASAFLLKPIEAGALLAAVRSAAVYRGPPSENKTTLDKARLASHMSVGGFSYIESMLEVYSRDAAPTVDRLRQHGKAGDGEAIKLILHPLKSNAAEVGDNGTVLACLDLSARIAMLDNGEGSLLTADYAQNSFNESCDRIEKRMQQGIDALRFFVAVKKLEAAYA